MLNSLVQNDGQHMHRAIGSTTCKKHKADVGMPCWVLPNSKNFDMFYYGICGVRIRAAGYVGQISPASMRKESPKKFKDGERKPFHKKATNRSSAPNSK